MLFSLLVNYIKESKRIRNYMYGGKTSILLLLRNTTFFWGVQKTVS